MAMIDTKYHIIHGRAVIVNQFGMVTMDKDFRAPYNKIFSVWVNCSGHYTPQYIRRRERQGKNKWK